MLSWKVRPEEISIAGGIEADRSSRGIFCCGDPKYNSVQS